MRRNQFSQPSSFQPSPKRRRIESRFFGGSSAQGITGSNNQDFISGFQNTQWSNSPAPPFPSNQRSNAPIEDEDLELDDFDLQLLAQNNTALVPSPPKDSNSKPHPEPHPKSHFGNVPISVRGVVLVPVHDLPDQYRLLFSFPLFNAVQSKCFNPVYNTNDNLVLSAPTGSGKTVIMELAICRLLNVLKDERFKVIYQAPTKSLCSERFRDWNTKFAALKLKCAELTGDTDNTQLRNVQSSQIIITTPEKWDSMTRKCKDHMRLMQLVKLFLIDEVHILKETRGATLEAVVSRMKNIGSNVRFIALSATVPNSEDIATWLGKDATNQHIPAHREHFGEDFRPVKLQKFVYGYQSAVNDFAFDKLCGSKLPEIIENHSCQKPIMIFCCTRNSSAATAKELARLWNMTNPPARLWKGPSKRIEVHNDDLSNTISAGVAFHHAGLGPNDRNVIEKGFLDGHINVICCTSTLAVGVNLPCHLVIIKNTVGWQDGGCKEYSDLEMMQMLGRAGRPQFDDSAVAVILTRKERVSHYERLVSGTESLESCLHLNLIDHLNAEIGLGNVKDVESATKWLAGTFLFVRLRRNPTYYKLKEGATKEDEDELLSEICEKDIHLLRDCKLVEEDRLLSTEFGEAMARYYIRFETMKVLLSLGERATIAQILDVIVQADEFREIRFKAGEKSLFKEINRDQGIKFPIKVDIALPSHKISLLLQSELGGIDFPTADQFQKHKFQNQQDKNMVFAHVNRLIRCLIDCLIARGDSVSTLNALELARSFGARVWDQSPLQMKQIDQIGVVAVRKLAGASITGIEAMEDAEPHQLEMILSKNPPFGSKLLSRLKEFPKLRVAMKMAGKEWKNGCIKIQFRLEVAFMNDKVPTYFQRRPVNVCCLTETSDGRLIDFRRISANKLQNSMEIILTADLRSSDQYLTCHVMCDEIAGTARHAEIRPDIASYFPSRPSWTAVNKPQPSWPPSEDKIMKTETFDGDDLGLDDFLGADQQRETAKKAVPKDDFNLEDDWISIQDTPSPPPAKKPRKAQVDPWEFESYSQSESKDEPVRLGNGNWACSHKCKDKKGCKHLCCKVGLEKRPKPAKKKAPAFQNPSGLNQLTLSATITKADSAKKSQKSKAKAAAEPKSNDKSRSALPAQQKESAKSKPKTDEKRKESSLFNKSKMPEKGSQVAPKKYADDDITDFLSSWDPDEEKSKAKAIAEPKLNEKNRSVLPAQQKESTRSGQKTDEKQMESFLFSKSKIPEKGSQVPPKKHADDDFTDFLSSWDPSEETWADIPQPPSIQTPKFDESARICIDLTSENSPRASPSKIVNPTAETEPTQSVVEALGGEAQSSLTTPINTRTTSHWFDSTLPPGDEVFSPANSNSTPLTMPLTMRSGNIPTLKRKAELPDQQLQEPPQKRVEEYSSQEIISAFTTLNEPAEEDYLSTESDGSGWDDVDRLLLEELKNIANFH